MLTKTDITQALKENNKFIDLKFKENNKLIDIKFKKNNKLIDINLKKAISENNQKLLNIFPTIKYLEDNFATKAELHESTNKILTAIDQTYGVVKKIDIEQAAMSYQIKNHLPAMLSA